MRAGRYIQQATGYRAFIPAPLPPDPPIAIASLEPLLSEASVAVGRLDGSASTLLDPDLFVAMYVRREAVLSSQIEGTQSTLEDLLTYELDEDQPPFKDVEEVVNYVAAMNFGLRKLTELPLSRRLIREIHGVLLQGVRGPERSPGEFRASQNWIGAGNVPIARATFVPPPVHEMQQALDDFERFLNQERQLPALLHCGLAHAQFETIHPFLDGNGRVGRLLITFLLVYRGVLSRPLLYLSHYLKAHCAEYYDRLMAVRNDGDWEGWLRFFLEGVRATAEEASTSIRAINRMREEHHTRIREQSSSANASRLLDLLFRRPIINAPVVSRELAIAFNTATRLVNQLESLGMLVEMTGSQRNKRYQYAPYLKLFLDDAALGYPQQEGIPKTAERAGTQHE
jgi:Fic family protein